MTKHWLNGVPTDLLGNNDPGTVKYWINGTAVQHLPSTTHSVQIITGIARVQRTQAATITGQARVVATVSSSQVWVSQHVVEILALDPVPPTVVIRAARGAYFPTGFGTDGYVEVEGGTQEFPAPLRTIDPSKIFFRGSRAPISARHSGALVVDVQDGRESFVAPWNTVQLNPTLSSRFKYVNAGEEARLDIIAFQEYGREDLWWVLGEANGILNPFEEPMAGDRIQLPSLDRLLQRLGQVGTGTEREKFRP